jgi:hypothetical protein
MNPYLIEEAAELILDCGTKFSDTHSGQAVIEMARAWAKLEESRLSGPRMPVNEFVSRKEDMSPNGCLRLFKQDDGDVCVAVLAQDGTMASVEFCVPGMGGGRSGCTLNALNELAMAILEDNKTFPERTGD